MNRTVSFAANTPRRHILLIVVISLLITAGSYAAARVLHLERATDAQNYYEPIARNLLAGRGFTLDDGRPAIYNPPLFPLMDAVQVALANVTHLPVWEFFFAALYVTVSAVAVYGMARRVLTATRALIAALLWLTFPLFVWIIPGHFTELPFIAVFYLTVWALMTAITAEHPSLLHMIGIGSGAGVCMLLRSAGIGLGMLFALSWLLLRSDSFLRRLRDSSLILVASLLIVAPWTVWLYNTTGRFIPLGSNGPGSMRDGLTFAVNSKGYRQSFSLPDGAVAFSEQVERGTPSHVESYDELLPPLIEVIKQSPSGAMQLLLVKIGRSWYGTDSGRFEFAIIALQGIYLGLALWGMRSAWRGLSRSDGAFGASQRFIIFTGLVVLYYWALTVTVLSIARYMLPAAGLLVVWIAAIQLKPRPINHPG